MSLYQDLVKRGLVKQVTDPKLEENLEHKTLTLYCGFDPTANSLHVGSLLPLLTLRRFQLAGHRVIALVGGATGMIGDPSGKSQERQLLTEEILTWNRKGIAEVMKRFLEWDGASAAKLVDNYDWFQKFSYIQFLRDVGKHFTVNHMMGKESVRARLEDREHGISYTEFSYMLLQAYDFVHLHQEEGCTLQIGGSDQWGNITAGNELIRRLSAAEGKEAPEVFGLTLPLVTKADGTKFGKSEDGAIWLSSDRTSPYEFYQFFLNTSDADVITYLKYFTFLSLDEIAELEIKTHREPEKRSAQTRLAQELTRLVHGEEELQKVVQATSALFGGGNVREMDANSLLQAFSDAPSSEHSLTKLSGGFPLLDALVESGLCSSKGAARKDIQGGGINVNQERVSDPLLVLQTEHLLNQQFILLRKGKKQYHLLRFLSS